MSVSNRFQNHKTPIIISISICVLFVISRVLRFTLSSLSDGFVVLLFQLAMWLTVFFGIIATIYFAIKHRGHGWPVRIIPLFFYISTIVSPACFNYTTMSIDADIFLKQSRRETSIHHIIETFSSNPRRKDKTELLIDLPPSEHFLSDGGGQVVVREDGAQTIVMFYIWRGFLDSSSGFIIYTSDNSEPQTPLMHDARRIKDHWFFGVE